MSLKSAKRRHIQYTALEVTIHVTADPRVTALVGDGLELLCENNILGLEVLYESSILEGPKSYK
jgi:hypothetical protein